MIEIIQAIRTQDDSGFYWICWLELAQDSETWWLPAIAPGDLSEVDLLAHFETREAELWRVAEQKQYQPDIHEHIQAKQVLKAFVFVLMDEINILRLKAGLEPRTVEQLRQAIKGKL